MTFGLIECLRRFNAKERFFLVGQALGNPQFTLGREFRTEIADTLGLRLPEDPFCAMDYHLDWLYAGLQMRADGGENRVYPNDAEIIKAQQEDVDLLIGYADNDATHIIVVEAKGVTGWTNSQMQSKAARLMEIFGDDGCRWAHVVPHFILMSPRESKGLKVSEWPKWMAPGGRVSWIELHVPTDLKRVSRCGPNGTPSADGKFWTIVNR